MLKARRVIKKVTILGDSAVGKTSLVRRYIEHIFTQDYVSTVGASVSRKRIKVKPEYIDGKQSGEPWDVELVIWDVLGQKGFRRVYSHSLRDTAGIILICDLTNDESVENLKEYWLKSVCGEYEHIPVVVLANKSDLANQQMADDVMSQIRQAIPRGLSSVLQTSAKTGQNVEKAFFEMARYVIISSFSEDKQQKKPRIIRSSKKSPASLRDEVFDEINYSNKLILDKIIDDFILFSPKKEEAASVVHTVSLDIRLDLNNANRQTIQRLIKAFAEIEIDYLSEYQIKKNIEKRLHILEEWDYKKKIEENFNVSLD